MMTAYSDRHTAIKQGDLEKRPTSSLHWTWRSVHAKANSHWRLDSVDDAHDGLTGGSSSPSTLMSGDASSAGSAGARAAAGGGGGGVGGGIGAPHEPAPIIQQRQTRSPVNIEAVDRFERLTDGGRRHARVVDAARLGRQVDDGLAALVLAAERRRAARPEEQLRAVMQHVAGAVFRQR